MKVSFETVLFRYPGKGGWTFATVPPQFAPPFRFSFGRTPVKAELNGREWETSVWTEKSGKILLPIPKKIRGSLGDGDSVHISIEYVFRFNPDSGDKLYES
ncbi:MAG: DUF1905 domain-containing protein [Ignavibacteriaceae bacterium]|nr:DUF1905 domain-containing protein [Ignavibacteriaceae bacterium]